MIPIASSPSLSNEKTAQLLQILTVLKDDKVPLPPKLSESFNAVLDAKKTLAEDSRVNDAVQGAQQTLIKETYDFLRHTVDIEDEAIFLSTKTIVETCPEFLATKDNFGKLPIHHAVFCATASFSKYFKLYIDVGLKHEIGGKDMRGGLLEKSFSGCVGLNYVRDPEIFELLRQRSPPLFYVEDIKKFHILHHVIEEGRNLNLVQYICNLDPSSIIQTNKNEQFPIQCFDWYDMGDKKVQETLQYLIQTSMSHSSLNETIGCLFTLLQDDFDVIYMITHMVEMAEYCSGDVGAEAVWDCIERALSKQREVDYLPCIMHQTILHTPQHCAEVIKRFPNSVHLRDEKNMNRLPIHIALESGLKWSLELEYLIATSQEYLKDVDPVTKCPPFVLAAMGTNCDLRTIYDLLHNHPEHVEMLEDSSGYKYIAL